MRRPGKVLAILAVAALLASAWVVLAQLFPPYDEEWQGGGTGWVDNKCEPSEQDQGQGVPHHLLLQSLEWTADPTDQFGAGFGVSVSSAGDVNNDGYSDVIIGAYSWDGEAGNEGRAYVYHGGPGGLSAFPDWTADPTDQGSAYFGFSVSSAGDVNNDGYSDVIIGAYSWDGEAGDEGRAYVYHGGPGGLSPTPNWTADPTDQTDAAFGFSVSSAGDVNNDGYGDVVIGARTWTGVEQAEGRAYVYHGGPGGLSAFPDWTADPTDQFAASFGFSVSSAGDVNNDGYGDVIIGAYAWNGEVGNEGRAYVYHGSSGGLSAFPDWTADPTDQFGSGFGMSVSSAGDVNNDGYGDVIIGAESWWDGGPVLAEGRAYAYHGSSGGLSVFPDWTADPTDQFGALFGVSVSSAGDMNNDGYDDVIIGANRWDGEAEDEGRAYVYRGGSGGLSANPDWTADPTNFIDACFGESVSCAGDVNNGGYSDIIIGAPRWSGEGRAYVYHGEPFGLHDVGTARVLEPPDTVRCDSIVPVAAEVCNYGDTVETFDVEAIIDSSGVPVYGDTMTVAALDSGACDTVNFATWTVPPVHGVSYSVTVVTLLNDANPRNDTAFKVALSWCPGPHDVGTASVDQPPDVVKCDSVYPVEATVCNYGDSVETFDVGAVIDSSGTVVYGDTVTISDLAAGECDTASFMTWPVPPVHGVSYSVTVVTLLNDPNPGNDTAFKAALSSCQAVHDVGTEVVLQPPDTVGCGTTVPVAARVCNYGDTAETFDVEAVIDSGGPSVVYAETLTVVGLDTLECDTVIFPNWVVPSGHDVLYTITVTTLLLDANQANNMASKTALSWCPTYHDVGTDTILQPPDTVLCDSSWMVRAQVSNYGDTTETFDVRAIIDSSGAAVYDDTATVAMLPPDSCCQVDFRSWYVPPDHHQVSYTVTVTTMLPTDMDSTNDTKAKGVIAWCPPGVEEVLNLPVTPSAYGLGQSRPNPAAGQVSIDYQLPHASAISLRVYDLKGRLVRTLVAGQKEAGLRTVLWDGRDDAGGEVAAGIYFCRMVAGDFVATRRMVLLR